MALGLSLFNLCRDVLRTRGLIRHQLQLYPGFQRFLDYVRNTYIADKQFPSSPLDWHRDMDTRTNNIVESFHSELNSAVMVKHPLWTFIRHLKDFHSVSVSKIRNANLGGPRPKRMRKWRLVDETLLRLKRQYVLGQRNLHSYWSNVCYYVKEFVPARR